jgi:hypothetical protein
LAIILIGAPDNVESKAQFSRWNPSTVAKQRQGYGMQLSRVLECSVIQAISHRAQRDQQANAAEQRNGCQRSIGVGASCAGDKGLSESSHFSVLQFPASTRGTEGHSAGQSLLADFQKRGK